MTLLLECGIRANPSCDLGGLFHRDSQTLTKKTCLWQGWAGWGEVVERERSVTLNQYFSQFNVHLKKSPDELVKMETLVQQSGIGPRLCILKAPRGC